jgi:toxin YoeB
MISFSDTALEHFGYWIKEDKRMSLKILKLIEDIQRDPFSGRGKPEPLKGNLSGFWSRRIDEEHRLVYQVEKNQVLIISCRFHYSP